MKKKILIIDDDVIYRKIIQKLLYSEYNLIFAENYSETIDVMKNGNSPDLIIADLNIPGISGIELIKMIKEKIKNNQIPIIVISGMDDDYLKEQLFQIGIYEFLIKPIDRKELKFKISELFSTFKSS